MRQQKTLAGRSVRALFAALALGWAGGASADELRIAVTSNFRAAMGSLEAAWEAHSGHRLQLSFGSTGKHYAQIRNGAPFDVFLAADSLRPELLERDGLAAPGSRFTYAVGRLVLWSPQPDLVDADGAVLHTDKFRRLAIANPEHAPYGAAAREVLEALGQWQRLSARIVRGENVAQAFHFVSSGNAELGFFALAQTVGRDEAASGSSWRVPQALYTPIRQQAVLLSDSAPARSFLAWLRGDRATAIICDYGYDLP